jgi:hypothetical protein
MRPLASHCHFGLGKLHRHANNREQARLQLAIAAMFHETGMTYWLK